MSLTWTSGRDTARCIPCNTDRAVDDLFTAMTDIGTLMRGTLCTVCASVTVHGGEMQAEPDDAFIDSYVQSEAGIDAILRNLYRVDRGPGTTFLDVGANYGFATRFARDVLGWNALGVEPSYSGVRGSRELGVEILGQYVTAETTLGRTFDVILASEVIEHVPDPRAFLKAMRVHLSPGGILLLTTPAAEIVRSQTETLARQAVGAGGHLFVASTEALHTLLADVGFASATVQRDGLTLFAAAATDPGLDLGVESTGPSQAVIAAYLEALETDPASTDALRAAMSVRRFRTQVNMGVATAADEQSMIDTLRSVYTVDLDDPRGVARRLAADDELPLLVAPAAFACGMRRVVQRIEWDRAVQHFALAEAAVADKRRRRRVYDGDSSIIEGQARAHRALAMLHTDPAAAIELWSQLASSGELIEPASWTVRLFVEASASGLGNTFDAHLDEVAAAVASLGAAGGASHAIAAIDAGYLLAARAVGAGDRWCATQWVSVAESLLAAHADVLDPSWAVASAANLGAVREQIVGLRPEAVPSTIPMPGPEHERQLWELSPVTAVPGAVSVVIALYNGSRYIVEAVQSVAAQSAPPLELIIVDDGGSDDSLVLIAAQALPFDVRIVRQGNAGQSAARNAGIRAARGEYIAFLDQDDAWRPNHLAELTTRLADEPEIGWLFADFDLVDVDGETIARDIIAQSVRSLDRSTLADLLTDDLMALPSASLMRRDALRAVGGFDRRLSGYEDDELYVRLFRAGWRIAPLPRATVRYRSHDANASSSVAFLRSRLVFLEILLRRAGRSQQPTPSIVLQAVLPRLLRSTVHDYATAMQRGDDELASTIGWVLGRLTSMRPGSSKSRRLAVGVLSNPALTRRLLRVSLRLPARVRARLIPPMLASQVPRILGSSGAEPMVTLDLSRRPARKAAG